MLAEARPTCKSKGAGKAGPDQCSVCDGKGHDSYKCSSICESDHKMEWDASTVSIMLDDNTRGHIPSSSVPTTAKTGATPFRMAMAKAGGGRAENRTTDVTGIWAKDRRHMYLIFLERSQRANRLGFMGKRQQELQQQRRLRRALFFFYIHAFPFAPGITTAGLDSTTQCEIEGECFAPVTSRKSRKFKAREVYRSAGVSTGLARARQRKGTQVLFHHLRAGHHLHLRPLSSRAGFSGNSAKSKRSPRPAARVVRLWRMAMRPNGKHLRCAVCESYKCKEKRDGSIRAHSSIHGEVGDRGTLVQS